MKIKRCLILHTSHFALSLALLQPSSINAVPVVTGVACGEYHSLFVKSDGSLWVMGYNQSGQLGIGPTPTSLFTPTQIVSSAVASVGACGYHSLFRMGSSLWVMGENQFGELGDGTTTNHFFPEKVFSGSGSLSVTVIGCGFDHSLFGTSGLVAGSTGLRAMGFNSSGQLGDGTLSNRDVPEIVVAFTGISAVAGGNSHSLFIRSDSSLWGMGENSLGQLGLGALPGTNNAVPIISSNVTAVAAGFNHSLFVKSDGSLWVMGENHLGQLGDGTTNNQHSAIRIPASNVVAVAAGEFHSLFIESDGSLWGMGYNRYGQLGDGTTNDHSAPIRIVASNVVAAAAGGTHSLFIKSDGSLWGMGGNHFGQLGSAVEGPYLTPFKIVAGLSPTPSITGFSFSGTDLSFNAANGVSGETLYTLMSADPGQPLSQWQPIATNVLGTDGNFSITVTNAADPNVTQRFYLLQAQ